MPIRKPSLPNRRVGRRLRALRDQARLTLDEAAVRLEIGRSSLSRVETGHTRCNVHLARSMMDLYDVRDDDLLDLIRQTYAARQFRTYSAADMGYVDAEIDAVHVDEYAVMCVPGLLQTEPYIRALFGPATLRRSAAKLEEQIDVRLVRQHRLTSEERPLTLTAVIDEAALHREVGDRVVMRDQLTRLVEVSALPTVSLRVLPQRLHSAMNGAFIVLTFPDPEEVGLLYVSHVAGAEQDESPAKVRAARLVFEQLLTEAHDPAESISVIERVRAERWGP